MRTIHDVVNRLRAEFLEMPGLRLKADQVRRLCGVEQMVCQTVLDVLVHEQFLCVKPDGQYARLTDGHHSHPAKAALRANTKPTDGRHLKKTRPAPFDSKR